MSTRYQSLFWLLASLTLLAVRAAAKPAPPVDLFDWVPRLAVPKPIRPPVATKPAVVAPAPKPTAPKLSARVRQALNGACTIAWLRTRLWWRETSYNAGPGITEIIRANGGSPREEYCGDTQAGAQRSCSLPVPAGSNGSYNWFLNPKRNTLLGHAGSFDSTRQGYKIGIFNARKGRIAHITAADVVVTSRNAPARGAWCIGGNEGSGTKAGMHRTWYPKANIYAAANYNY